MKRVLVIEDEPKIAALLVDYLTESGYNSQTCDNGLEAIEVFERYKPDCVLLDVMLPGKDGLTICREIRANSMVPIIMITARIDDIDRLLGLELGADDYLCKPFNPREVMVRIKNILNRIDHQNQQASIHRSVNPYGQNQGNIHLEYRTLKLDSAKFSCSCEGQSINLTAVEFRMLSAMVTRPGCIFSRNQLMDVAYSDERIVGDRTIDTHIKNIRKKFAEAVPGTADLIHSIYGVGYKLE